MWISWIAIIIAVVAALVVAFDERALKNRLLAVSAIGRGESNHCGWKALMSAIGGK